MRRIVALLHMYLATNLSHDVPDGEGMVYQYVIYTTRRK